MLFGSMDSGWKAEDMPDLSTWHILITGGSSGLGFAAARELLRKNAHVYLLSENMAEGHQAVSQLKQELPNIADNKLAFYHVDLTDFTAVKQFADHFQSKNIPLHVLINNAGVSLPSEGREEPKTNYGVEKQLATNVYGPLLLTQYLLTLLKNNTPSRIVFMASASEAKGEIPEDLKGGVTPDTSFANYASTNLLRLALTRVFAEELRTTGVTVYAVEPGQSDTPIFGKQSASQPMGAAMKTLRALGGAQEPKEGALSMLYAATTAPDAETGSYYGPYYMSAGVSTNTGNTEKRQPLSPELEDAERCRATYKSLVGVLEQLTGAHVPNVLLQSGGAGQGGAVKGGTVQGGGESTGMAVDAARAR